MLLDEPCQLLDATQLQFVANLIAIELRGVVERG